MQSEQYFCLFEFGINFSPQTVHLFIVILLSNLFDMLG
nr:MAG TPA: hypothetical protein [Caudoviricetes sp.]